MMKKTETSIKLGSMLKKHVFMTLNKSSMHTKIQGDGF